MRESSDQVRHDGEPEPPADEEKEGTGGSSTVQLRVRDTDNVTTFLRAPDQDESRATTFLRMPSKDEAKAAAVADAASAADRATAEAAGPAAAVAAAEAVETVDAPIEEPKPEPAPEPEPAREPEPAPKPLPPVDPRLAILEARPTAAPPAPEPAAPPAAAVPAALAATVPTAVPAKLPATLPMPAPVEPLGGPSDAPAGPPPTPARTAAPAQPYEAAQPAPPAVVATPLPHPLPQAPSAPEPASAGLPENTNEAMDVLAALSARPVSPLRRALKRITIWTLFVGFLVGAVVVAQLLRPLPGPKAKITMPTSFSFTGDPLALPWPAKGQAAAEVVGLGSLGSKGPDTPVPIASVTKVMNAYLILQGHPLKKGESGPAITVDKAAAQESGDADQSTAKVTEGQQISEYEALEMLMLPSANNIARLLARWDAGSEDAFVKKMNDQAAGFGMTNTTYADAAGYNASTKSTAKDQIKLAEQVMGSEIFRQIVAEPDATIGTTKIFNTNYLLSPKNGVIGVKTGSSTPAGSCLMWAATKEIGGTTQLIVGVTLGQPATATDTLLKAAQTVSSKIITAGQAALTGHTLAKQGEVVGYVDDGLGGRAPVVATKDVTVAGWTGVNAGVTLTQIPGGIGHSAKAGTPVGTITVGQGASRTEIPVALQHDLAPPSIMSRLTRTL